MTKKGSPRRNYRRDGESCHAIGNGVHAVVKVDQTRFPPDHPPSFEEKVRRGDIQRSWVKYAHKRAWAWQYGFLIGARLEPRSKSELKRFTPADALKFRA
jgi:hypothetical protein